MHTRIVRAAPTVALVLAFGGPGTPDAMAQEASEASQCRAVLSPSTLTAPVVEDRDDRSRARRIAGKVTLQARLSEEIGPVREVRIEPSSNVRIALASEEPAPAGRAAPSAREDRPPESPPETVPATPETIPDAPQRVRSRRDAEEEARNRIPIAVDVSEAVEGEWKVTLVGRDGEECGGTLRIRAPGRSADE